MPTVTTPSALILDHHSGHNTNTLTAPPVSLPPQIRHAGRAHIRGKIRRVWRHRYLELFENGLVRYYELPVVATIPSTLSGMSPTTADMNMSITSDWDHVDSTHNPSSQSPSTAPNSMIPKYTLAIYSARILDATTIRDMHVGLPRGSFGFLFRGQRLLHMEEPNNTAGTGSSNAANAMSPLASSSLSQSQQSSSSQQLSQSQSQSHPSQLPPLSMSATISSCRPQEAHVKEQRDFLCAVSSLEEAQTWVVALQWAATQQQQHRDRPMPEPWWWKEQPETTEGAGDGDMGANTETGDGGGSPRISWPEESVATTVHNDLEFSEGTLVSTPPRKLDTASALPQSSTSTPQRQRQQQPQQKVSLFRGTDPTKSMGKMIVTKVTQFRTVRVSSWQWEIAYEIQGLLVKSRHVETWKMLRTADDFQSLIANLSQELGPALLDRSAQMGPIQQLPRLNHLDHQTKEQAQPTRSQLQASLSTVDSILRSLVMDAAMINAASMKVFLGLGGGGGGQQFTPAAGNSTTWSLRWWCLHDANKAVWDRRTRTLPSHVTLDQYVKQWLIQQQQIQATVAKQSSLADMYAATALQRPLLFVGGLGICTVAVCPLACLWQQMMPTVSIRLDYLIGSWIGVAYMGHYYCQGNTLSNNHNTSSDGEGKKKKAGAVVKTRKPQVPSVESNKRLDKDATTVRRHESHDSEVIVLDEEDDVESTESVQEDDGTEEESDGEEAGLDKDDEDAMNDLLLSSPLPEYPTDDGFSCWSQPDATIFRVRGATYLKDKVKIQSDACPLTCRGVDVWMTDNPQRHIARHPSVLGGKLGDEDTFLVNFLLPFGNFVAYFSIPPLNKFPKKLRSVWTKFLNGDQQYRDARLKLLPIVVDGPWIVKAAVGPGGTAPALLGKVIPLQYFFRDPDKKRKGVYEVDVIITASTIAKGILSVVKGHTKALTIAFAFIIEASEQEELPETVLCSFQVHSLHLEDCPLLPDCNLDEIQ
jgi:hypothetical protein